MDSSAAGDSAATGRTVGGRSVNFSGCRGHPLKKPSFGRDDRLARDGARLMTGPFRPPALLLLPAAPAAASTSTAAALAVVAAAATATAATAEAEKATAAAGSMTAMSDDDDEDEDDGYDDDGRQQWWRLPAPVPIDSVV